MPTTPVEPSRAKRDERVKINAAFEDALRALLKVDPATVPAEPNGNGKPAGKPRAKKPAKP